jgi:hypothetical protein
MSNFMMNMISWVLLLLVILTLYLIDKVNELAKIYEAPKPEAPLLPEPELASDLLFAGLEGKDLWDAMNGKQLEGFDRTLIEALRPHYEPILREHIVATFKDGLEEVGGNENFVPNSLRRIDTVRGYIQSWLPPQHLGSIYRNALEFASLDPHEPDMEVLGRLKRSLDSVVEMLYQRVSITNEVPFSEFLYDRHEADIPAPEHEEAMLALSDQSGQTELIENSDFPEHDEAERLAQGIEQVQAYEDQQRQEVAAETIDAVMQPATQELEAKPV